MYNVLLISIICYILLWLYSPFIGPWPLLISAQSVGLLERGGDQPIVGPQPTHRTTQVGFELTTPVSERVKDGSSFGPAAGHCDRRYAESIHVIKEECTVFIFA
jgi:hypothetical protein